MMKLTALVMLVLLVLIMPFSYALNVQSVGSENFSPGQEGNVRIEIENTLSDTITDVGVELKLSGLPFVSVGSSQESTDEIDEDDEETFNFVMRAAFDAKPGDYEIPYMIKYNVDNNEKTINGTFGVRVEAQPVLEISANVETPVIGQQTKLTIKIVNTGFADARFVSIKISPKGYTLLSENNEYIGCEFDKNLSKYKMCRDLLIKKSFSFV